MAVWSVAMEGDEVVLRYFDGERVQECGRGPVVLLQDVVQFASAQAEPFDVVETPAGTFVKQGRAGAAGGQA